MESGILAAAGRLFRQRGFDGVTVADVMKDAGLTHGAFYGYFPSKEALIAEAVGKALPWLRIKPSRAALRRNSPTTTSASSTATILLALALFSSLGTEAARGSADLRHRMTEAVRCRIDHLSAEAEGDTTNEKRRAAIAAWSAMIGAMVLARLVDDDRLSKEILKESRAALPLK